LRKNNLIKLLIFFIAFSSIIYFDSIKGYCKNIVVVIDPGHGGDSIGGNMDNRIERDINLITAQAVRERLSQYDDVEVYLTRENNTDKELSREERFKLAKKLNADFLFSIHYNMSEYHTLFGSEVWVASQGSYYTKGYAFAKIEMEALTGLGLFDRGIKNKLNDNKNGEYYGILKYAEDYNIPAVIIEHCHLDEERDSAFWNEEAYKQFGYIDAESIAKYFNLSSSSLDIDYSDYPVEEVSAPDHRLDVDSSEPEYCELSIDSYDDTNTYATIKAKDSDTYVQYYQISTDGGNSYPRLEPWENRTVDQQSVVIPRAETDQNIVVKVFNQYEYCTTSNTEFVPAIIVVEETVAEDTTKEDFKDADIDLVVIKNKISSEISPVMILVVTLVALFILFNLLFFAVVLSKSKKRKKRVNKKRETLNAQNNAKLYSNDEIFEFIDDEFDWK